MHGRRGKYDSFSIAQLQAIDFNKEIRLFCQTTVLNAMVQTMLRVRPPTPRLTSIGHVGDHPGKIKRSELIHRIETHDQDA